MGMTRACECWQERKVREKSRGKGNQKGGREREKKRLVSAKKDREDQEKSKDRISGSDGCKWWLVERKERHLLWGEKCGKLSGLQSKQPSESPLRMG